MQDSHPSSGAQAPARGRSGGRGPTQRGRNNTRGSGPPAAAAASAANNASGTGRWNGGKGGRGAVPPMLMPSDVGKPPLLASAWTATVDTADDKSKARRKRPRGKKNRLNGKSQMEQ